MSKIKIQTICTVIFISIVFSGFYIGFSISNSDTILVTERRRVAEFPKLLLKDSRSIKNFFYNIDKYINDRLLYKDYIFKKVSKIFSLWFYKYEVDTTIRGLNGWLFLGNNYNYVVDRHTKEIPLYMPRANFLLEEYSKIKNTAKEVNSEFLLLICPDKHGIYYEYIPPFVKNGVHYRYVNKLINFFIQNEISVLDLYPSLIARKKKENIYYKTDTHWNLKGAEIGFIIFYKWLQDNILKKDLAPLAKYTIQSDLPREGDLISIGGYYGFTYQDDYNYKFIVDDLKVNWKEEDYFIESPAYPIKGWKKDYQAYMINRHAKNNIKLLIFCDSFMTSFAPFLNINFSDILYVNSNINLDKKINLINQFRPHITIIESVERSL